MCRRGKRRERREPHLGPPPAEQTSGRNHQPKPGHDGTLVSSSPAQTQGWEILRSLLLVWRVLDRLLVLYGCSMLRKNASTCGRMPRVNASSSEKQQKPPRKIITRRILGLESGLTTVYRRSPRTATFSQF